MEFINAPIPIQVVTALVSAVVAWATSRISVRAEIQKLRLAVQQQLLEKLVAARLAVYPDLYALLSDLLKATRTEDHTQLRDLLDRINAWDSKHAILFGPDTTNICFDFRQTLSAAARPESRQDKAGDKLVATLLQKAEQLELALRSDLGIYGVDILRARKLQTPRIKSYTQV